METEFPPSGIFPPIGMHRVYNGISNCTQGMNLKLTPEMLLDKRCWLMTSSLWSHDPCVFYRPENILWCQRRLANDVINQLLLSRGLTGESFRLLASLDPKIWHGLAFPCKAWSVSFDCLKNKILCSCALRMISKCF